MGGEKQSIMIDTKDIRMGNLVLDKHGKPSRVSEIAKTGIKVEGGPGTYRQYAGEFSPININAEWLIKLGLKMGGPNINATNFSIDGFGVSYHYDDSGYYSHNAKLSFVHQIQNLYYALTGKELKVNMELL